MRQPFFILFVILFSTVLGCKNKNTNLASDLIVVPSTASGKSTDKYPIMTFEKTTHDFGQVIRGEKLTYRFKFTNTGKTPLIISSVSSSCGCTVPDFSKLPTAPGQDGFVTITFNSQGLDGFNSKSVNVFSNGQPSAQTLTITSNVVSPNSK